MATNDTTNNESTTESTQSTTEDTTAGDILEQLKAESASTTNLYKLEQKMFKTVTDINKNLVKQQKVESDMQKSVQSMSATLMSVNRHAAKVATTLTSVDSNLKEVLSLLQKMQNKAGGPAAPGAATTPPPVSTAIPDLDDTLNELISVLRVNEISARMRREDEERRRDTNVENKEIARKMKELYDAYDRGEMSQEELREAVDAVNERLKEATEALNGFEDILNTDSGFSFSNAGKSLEKQFKDAFKARTDEILEQGRAGSFSDDLDENTRLTEEALLNARGDFEDWMANATQDFGPITVTGVKNIQKVGETLDGFIDKFSHGGTYDAKTGTNTTASATVEAAGKIGGTLVGAEVGAAIGTAIGGPVGTVVGGILGDLVGSKIEALASIIGDRLDYLANHSKKTRDEILKAGLTKIENDVKDMATYSIEVYSEATQNIYSAWDKNLSQITATQGYTKEALNSLQDSVAQRLQDEGYGATIDASQYLDSLANTLNANLGGTLAEAFAAQNLILQKAVPEVDLSQSAAEFAAIYASANRSGENGEETMIAAMNEIAGAAKALETVTEGNNQFLKETSTLLTKATEVVNIAGGNADQIAGLTTQMMASEAAITSVAPQLSGFTNELVGILMNNNDATAVSLRAIMNDIDSNIGVSATSFMQSFMEDTQGTLSTAFAAIQRFIDQNENEASRQEFLNAMESVFGVQGSKLAQIDFGGVSELIAGVNTSTNMAALTNAENLVRSGETTTLEEQLVANTANQLLATNAVAATLDNKLMRKLEKNELEMEKLVYSAQATQSVELAENTLSFFTKITDLIMSIIDPFGLFDMFTTSINAATSAAIDAERYLVTATMSNIGSTVTSGFAGQQAATANTIGGATAVIAAAETKSTDAMVAAVESSGVSPTFEHMMLDYSASTRDAQAAMAANQVESNAISYAAMEQQAKNSSEYQQKQTEAQQQDAKYEEDKAAAREQQRAAQEAEDIRNLENHDNIVIIKDALDGLDMSSYLEPILAEHRTHTEQLKEVQAQTEELVHLLSTIIEYSMVNNPEFASTISYDERSRIMDNGYVTNSTVPFF